MILALVLMFGGFGAAVWGHIAHNVRVLVAGFVTILVVCASWWFWVMFVIRTMIKYSIKTTDNLGDIKVGIREVKHLLAEYEKAKIDK